jgi:hypothetical protein
MNIKDYKGAQHSRKAYPTMSKAMALNWASNGQANGAEECPIIEHKWNTGFIVSIEFENSFWWNMLWLESLAFSTYTHWFKDSSYDPNR